MTAIRSRGETPARPPDRGQGELGLLRAALRAETQIAEALAQRSRGLLDVVEALARRALAEAGDIAEASARLDALSSRMREALAAGETVGGGSDLAALVERTLAPFETGAGPRIAAGGPAVGVSAEAARLVALTLFELAGLSMRRGALSGAEGRVLVAWSRWRSGLRISWRDIGGPPVESGLRLGAGASLLPLLEERFGAPLKVRQTPLGLRAELTLPEAELTSLPDGGLIALTRP
ncbi:hypothetical protein [Amaricoccus sp.]|uniref:hypothetical protein n=1 Tax=Amaricoccus sp. TaxID=1872485 RepID=UPI001B75487E|nr:hypothetical protein [Amaricoccus sp.]MBP7000366.1 hypothetical protein [Amaricoccus sp.]